MKNLICSAPIIIYLMTGAPLVQIANAQEIEVENKAPSRVILDTVVVTGTKKADPENVQDVPVSVTAFGSEQIEALKIRDLQGLTYTAPNVALDDIGTTKGVANFSIRGLGINSSIPSIDPTVGVFIDGMYLGINSGVVFDIFDLESIEVMRGPQGILFGRNTTGGAVLLNTPKPSHDFSGRIKLASESGFRGTGENFYAMAALTGGIVEDKLAAKLVVYHNEDNGWHKNKLGGNALESQLISLGGVPAFLQVAGYPVATNTEDGFQNHGASKTTIIRPSLFWTPYEEIEFTLRYEHGESKGDGPASQNHPGANGIINPFYSASRQSFDMSIDEIGGFDNQWDQLIAETRLDLGKTGVFTSITGWREYSSVARSDIDGTPYFLFHGNLDVDQEQFSEELRYNNTFGDVLDLTVGAFFFEQDIVYNEDRDLLGGSVFLNGGGIQNQSTTGIFGQVDYNLADTMTLTIGGRFTKEEKEATVSTLSLNPIQCDPGTTASCSEDFKDKESWSNFSPKIGLKWSPSESFNIYGHWTKGVRSGGYNLRNSNQAFSPGPFDEEMLDSYEIGFKSKPFGGGAIFNGAFFVNDISDMQREVNLADAQVGIAQIIRNTADARIFGVELEGNIAITESLLMQGSIGHLDGEYTSVAFDLSGDGVVDSLDVQLEVPRLAPWTWGLGLVHSLDLSDDIALDSRLNYSYRDKSFYTDNNLGFFNSVESVDASFNLSVGSSSISLYGKNLLNEVNHGADSQLPATLGFGAGGALMKGRVVGLELQTKF